MPSLAEGHDRESDDLVADHLALIEGAVRPAACVARVVIGDDSKVFQYLRCHRLRMNADGRSIFR